MAQELSVVVVRENVLDVVVRIRLHDYLGRAQPGGDVGERAGL
jgi:hypothetical protein